MVCAGVLDVHSVSNPDEVPSMSTPQLHRFVLFVLFTAAAWWPSPSYVAAQALVQKDQTNTTFTAEQRMEVLNGALKRLNDFYIFPDKAREMEKAIRARQEKKEYDGISSAQTFAETLTKHLQEVSHDKHLRVMYRREP